MSDITSLVFTQAPTVGRRRTSNVPQLQCMGNCPDNAVLTQAHCSRQGLDDMGKPTWFCQPTFLGPRQRRFGLGNVRVECEGCTGPGDTNVARGSCSLRYSVSARGSPHLHHYPGGSGELLSLWHVVWFLFLIVFLVLMCAACRKSSSRDNTFVTDGYGNVYGAPIHSSGGGAASVVHHHHGGYGGGYGGGGFGTGMLTGYLIGDALGHMSNRGHYGGGDNGYGGGDYGGGDYGGGDFGGGGFGGTDSI